MCTCKTKNIKFQGVYYIDACVISYIHVYLLSHLPEKRSCKPLISVKLLCKLCKCCFLFQFSHRCSVQA